MPMILAQEIVAAGAVNPNIYAGSAFEFARARGVISEGIAANAAGLFATLQAGGDVIAEEFSLPILTRYPIIPDEMYFTDVVEQGDRIVGRVRNPTANPQTVFGVVQLSNNQ